MEPSSGSMPEREEFRHPRNGEGNFHFFFFFPVSSILPKRFDLKRLCLRPHPRNSGSSFRFSPSGDSR